MFGSALAARSSCTTSTCPPSAAMCNAVSPSRRLLRARHPRSWHSRRRRKRSVPSQARRFLYLDTNISALCPNLFCRSGAAPPASSASMQVLRFFQLADGAISVSAHHQSIIRAQALARAPSTSAPPNISDVQPSVSARSTLAVDLIVSSSAGRLPSNAASRG